MKGTYYKITGIDKVFSSLNDAKIHIWFDYTNEERKILDGESIVKYINGEPVTEKRIKFKGERYGFGRTKRL